MYPALDMIAYVADTWQIILYVTDMWQIILYVTDTKEQRTDFVFLLKQHAERWTVG